MLIPLYYFYLYFLFKIFLILPLNLFLNKDFHHSEENRKNLKLIQSKRKQFLNKKTKLYFFIPKSIFFITTATTARTTAYAYRQFIGSTFVTTFFLFQIIISFFFILQFLPFFIRKFKISIIFKFFFYNSSKKWKSFFSSINGLFFIPAFPFM